MKKLLRIDCSSRVEGSHSRALANYFEKTWKIANPTGQIIKRDLLKQQLPHIQNKTIEGFYTPIEHQDSETRKATALSDELIAELKSVDELLISTPLYNLNVPSNLKAYIDQVVRIGHTFTTNEKGFYGLLENKTAHIITVKGGLYKDTPMAQFDFQDHYLKAILGFIGITVKELFSMEGTSDENVINENREGVYQLIDNLFNDKTQG